jgi:hypothetical protein
MMTSRDTFWGRGLFCCVLSRLQHVTLLERFGLQISRMFEKSMEFSMSVICFFFFLITRSSSPWQFAYQLHIDFPPPPPHIPVHMQVSK